MKSHEMHGAACVVPKRACADNGCKNEWFTVLLGRFLDASLVLKVRPVIVA